MQTLELAEKLAGLIDEAARERIALMCAEAVPWRCHRSLIGDALLVHGIRGNHQRASRSDSLTDTFCPRRRHGDHLSAAIPLNCGVLPVEARRPQQVVAGQNCSPKV
jgi:hypothetical protein